MSEPPIHWGAEALWQELVPLLPGLSVEVVARTLSTNTALLERARAAPGRRDDDEHDGTLVRRSVESAAFGRRAVDLQPCLLVAEHQTGGRGRQGRAWQSAAGASLTFSLGMALVAPDWSGLSLAVGVALAEALEPASTNASRIGLKWPNDLWLMDAAPRRASSGRKLGGVLIETVAAGVPRLVVVGIGLNVQAFDAVEASTGFAALQELDPLMTAPMALARVARPLVQALQQFERKGFAAFAPRFAARDLLRHRPGRTTLAEVPEGIARGVSPQGALLVQTAGGLVSVASGEVSVRLAGRP
jgi:BirA family biotin operon repressor/biotin-[acetyl-CoA-carboxylase] ligase